MEPRNKLTLCRLCLCKNECFVNIFERNDSQGYVAAEVISDLLQFQVSRSDCYPHVVCSTCLTKLSDFKLFKEFCLKSMVTYDKMFTSSDSLVTHQTEMVTIKLEEVIIGFNSNKVSEDPVKENEAIIKSEEVIIYSSADEESEHIFEETESEVSHRPLWLKDEIIPFRRDNHPQDELIDSKAFGNLGTVKLTTTLMQNSPQEQENIIAPEKEVRISKAKFECDHCKKVFTTKSRLIRHMKALGFENSYICEEEDGRKGTVPEKRVGRINDRFECHCCRKVLKTKGSLKWHLASHGIGSFFKCDVCGKICLSKWHIIKHIRQHTGERPYKCTSCSAMFTNNSSLNVHLRIHTNIKPFKCKECNFSCNYSSNLKTHMRLHSNLKPYSCGVCHAAFRQKSHLTSHLRTHSGDRPYKCTACSKAFSQSSTLRLHQVVHSGEKPHSCHHCGKRFSQRVSLKRHLKTVCVEKC